VTIQTKELVVEIGVVSGRVVMEGEVTEEGVFAKETIIKQVKIMSEIRNKRGIFFIFINLNKNLHNKYFLVQY
jgi:hypothetical protein